MFDFLVKYDPAVDTSEDLTKRILYSLFVMPIKMKKPRVLFISGDSGEGKSYSAIRLQELLCEIQNINIVDNFKAINVFTPLEYPKKLDALLHDKKLKKVNILCLHEARELIRAKNWHSFLTSAIADVNAMSRSIKRLCFIIISQFIRDITTDVRYTLNYYIAMKRNRSETRMYISKVWKDDRDLEKPKLRKRKIFGYVLYPNGKRRKIRPSYLIIKKPSQILIDMFDQLDTEAKSAIIRRKLNRLIADMEMDLQGENKKIVDMVAWYMAKPDKLIGIGRVVGDKFKLDKKFKEMHDLNKKETEEFVKMLELELKNKGAIEKSNVASYGKVEQEGDKYYEETSDANVDENDSNEDDDDSQDGGVEDDVRESTEST